MFEKIYPYEFGDLGPRKLPAESIHNTGLIVRVFSDIETLLTLMITQELDIPELKIHVLLGRLSISQKIDKLQTLFTIAKKGEKFSSVFDINFGKCLKIRNVLAHGFYLGPAVINDKITHLFRTSDIKEIGEENPISEVFGLSDAAIATAANDSIDYSRKIIEGFELLPLLNSTFQRALVPQKKARKPKQRGEKPKPQPQS